MRIPVYRYINGHERCTYFVCRLGEDWVAVAYSEGPLDASHWGLRDPVRILTEERDFIKRAAVERSVSTAVGHPGHSATMLTATLDLDTGELTSWETYAK